MNSNRRGDQWRKQQGKIAAFKRQRHQEIRPAIVERTNRGWNRVNRAALLSDFQAGRVTERPKISVTTEYVAPVIPSGRWVTLTGGCSMQGVITSSSEDVANPQRQLSRSGNVRWESAVISRWRWTAKRSIEDALVACDVAQALSALTMVQK